MLTVLHSTHVQTVDLDSAVLDIEWTPHVTTLGDVCCVATSTGSLEFFAFDAIAGKLQHTSKHQICDETTLVLDLLWHPSKPDTIAVTLSDGAVSICQSSGSTNAWNPNRQVTVTEVATHSLEPWTLAFSPDTSHLFSGGDDAVLQALQLSFDTDTGDASRPPTPSATPLWTDRKTHQAGVTAILPLANDLLITGSYDDHIRVIHAPPIGRRQVLAELDLGGGVWRLKMLDDGTVSRDADNGDRYVEEAQVHYCCLSFFLFLQSQNSASKKMTMLFASLAHSAVSLLLVLLLQPCSPGADTHVRAFSSEVIGSCLPNSMRYFGAWRKKEHRSKEALHLPP